MYCNFKMDKKVDGKQTICGQRVWVKGHSLCEEHFKKRYFTVWRRLKNTDPCPRCIEKGRIKITDDSNRDVIVIFEGDGHEAICLDCNNERWIVRPLDKWEDEQ